MPVLYNTFKKCIYVSFNILNVLLGGNLPPFGCANVVVEKQGRYLAVELPNGRIVLPGGFMRWGERPQQAARREAQEETGYQLEIGKMIGCYSCVSHKIDRMSTITMAFHAEILGGELRGSIEGKPRWVDEQILRENLSPFYMHILDDYLRYRMQCNKPNVSPL